MKKKPVSTKAMSNASTGSFCFMLFFDSHGYYIWWNSCNVVHCNHMKCALEDIPFQLKNLSEEERKHVRELANALTQSASA